MTVDRSSPAARADRLKAWDAAPRPFVTPSLLNCDFAHVADALDALKAAGVVGVHLDVMDGHFVPNLSYGAPVAADWRKVTDFPFDTHLMMSDPGRYLDDFVRAGCDILVVHIEVLPDPVPLLKRIREAGCRASLCLNPPTPLSAIEPFLDEVDAVLVMSVMPGFGGQKFDPSVLEKVRAIRAARPDLPISIDGGINRSTAADAVAAGATQLVVGSGVFRPDGNYAAALAELAEEIRRGRQRGSAPTESAGLPSHE
jgi:ribulose-phosphate 3-epimerase